MNGHNKDPIHQTELTRSGLELTIGKKRIVTRSGRELKSCCKIFVPIAPFGGSSNAVKAIVDNSTFQRKADIRITENLETNMTTVIEQ